jgi:hypothetical protein
MTVDETIQFLQGVQADGKGDHLVTYEFDSFGCRGDCMYLRATGSFSETAWEHEHGQYSQVIEVQDMDYIEACRRCNG